jgi:hypothetical protein
MLPSLISPSSWTECLKSQAPYRSGNPLKMKRHEHISNAKLRTKDLAVFACAEKTNYGLLLDSPE